MTHAVLAGVGQDDDSTLLLTWSVVWTTKKSATDKTLTNWVCRYPFAVLPMSVTTPETIEALMGAFASKRWPYNFQSFTCQAGIFRCLACKLFLGFQFQRSRACVFAQVRALDPLVCQL